LIRGFKLLQLRDIEVVADKDYSFFNFKQPFSLPVLEDSPEKFSTEALVNQ